jgi:deazaflavin-dependent oxidoreductase (nitroreductase family)
MKRNRIVATAAVATLATAYSFYLRSGAYRNGNRLFYHSGRPNRAGRAFGSAWALAAGLGLTPAFIVSLETTGSRTGRRRAVPVVLADHAGARYVVSMLGERSPWVHNIRAADGRVVTRHGVRREVRLIELPPEARAPVIKAYLARALGARPHIPVDPDAPIGEFERIAARYPVFRLEPAPTAT